MERYEIEFKIRYAYGIECYNFNINSRLNKTFTFLQLFFSSFVFASVSGSSIYGGIVVVVTIASFVLDPAVKAANAKKQSFMLSKLIDEMNEMDDKELLHQYRRIIETGNDSLGMIHNAAYNRACIRQGVTNKDDLCELTFLEKCFAWLGGDLPRA